MKIQMWYIVNIWGIWIKEYRHYFLQIFFNLILFKIRFFLSKRNTWKMLVQNLKILTNILCRCEEQGYRKETGETGQRKHTKVRTLDITHSVVRSFLKINYLYILEHLLWWFTPSPSWCLLALSCLPVALSTQLSTV